MAWEIINWHETLFNLIFPPFLLFLCPVALLTLWPFCKHPKSPSLHDTCTYHFLCLQYFPPDSWMIPSCTLFISPLRCHCCWDVSPNLFNPAASLFIHYPLIWHFPLMSIFIYCSLSVLRTWRHEGREDILSPTISLPSKIVSEISPCSMKMWWINE